MLLRHIISGTDIDISLGILPFEVEMVERSCLIEVGTVLIRLPTPENLIIMKAIAIKNVHRLLVQTESGFTIQRGYWFDFPEIDMKAIQAERWGIQ